MQSTLTLEISGSLNQIKAIQSAIADSILPRDEDANAEGAHKTELTFPPLAFQKWTSHGTNGFRDLPPQTPAQSDGLVPCPQEVCDTAVHIKAVLVREE